MKVRYGSVNCAAILVIAGFLAGCASAAPAAKNGAQTIVLPKAAQNVDIVKTVKQAPAASAPQKVILDTDMVECFDDGIAMILLENSPNIDLLGVTVVAGNTSMPNGVSSGVRQLEIIGSHTPIYEGSRVCFRNYRLDPVVMAAEETISPVVSWAGYLRVARDPQKYSTIDFDPMADWKDVYRYKFKDAPVYKYVYGPSRPDPEGNKDAVDFIISQANKYPGEIVLLAIGPATNIARAILKDPTLPSKIKEIVYMGGSFYMPGNSSAVSEFNWWADPDAAKLAVRSVWGDTNSVTYKAYGNQVVSGLEASELAGGMPQDLYEKVLNVTYPGIRDLFIQKNGQNAPHNIWDVLAAAYIIDPSVVLSWNNHPVKADGTPEEISGVFIDVDSEMTADYGRSVAYKEGRLGPAGTQKAAIQNYIDVDKFWYDIVYPALVDPAN